MSAAREPEATTLASQPDEQAPKEQPPREVGIDQLIANIKWDAAGLLPAVVQDVDRGDVLMVAWMNAESLAITLATRRATYWSRSRQELWEKGATSGNRQEVISAGLDCDKDTLLLQVRQSGPACHSGTRSCFDDGPALLAAPQDFQLRPFAEGGEPQR